MDKILKFYVRVFFKVMGKVLSGELSCMQTGLVCLASRGTTQKSCFIGPDGLKLVGCKQLLKKYFFAYIYYILTDLGCKEPWPVW